MIKNSDRDLEAFLTEGFAVKSLPLLAQLEAAGVPYEILDDQVLLDQSLEILDPDKILQHSNGLPKGFRLAIYRQVGSTNEVVLKALADGAPMVCLAEMQTSGKGRRGRHWVSPFGRNIYLTIGYQMKVGIAELEGLSLVVGMQVVDVLRSQGLTEVGLKWPNDLLLNGGKLGGILVELRPPSAASVGVVIGLGINLELDESQAGLIDQPWSAVEEKLNISRNELAGQLISRLFEAVSQFERHGFRHFAEAWNTYNLYAGQTVRVIRGEETFIGVDRGVDESGNLLLETGSGLEAHNAGEVSLRPVEKR